MQYLYQPLEGDEYVSDVAPNEQETQEVIDDELRVYRIKSVKIIEVYTPIQWDDFDSWSDIPIKKDD